MVGERYRDLLSAADSIVRMRNAADKLVDRLESVQDSLSSVGGSAPDGEHHFPHLTSHSTESDSCTPSLLAASPTKRQNTLRSARQLGQPQRLEMDRTLSSSTTVAHALQLLLAVPSIAHAKLDAADFLGAARLEELGQVVYRTLVEARIERPPDRDGERVEEGETPGRQTRRLVEVFPLIEKQAEPLAALGPLITKRALVALCDWETEPAASRGTLTHTLSLVPFPYLRALY